MFSSEKWFGGTGDFYSHTIDQSLRFVDGDSAYLTRTNSSAGNRRTWTFSAWVKRGDLDASQNYILGGTTDNYNLNWAVFFFGSDELTFYSYTGTENYQLHTHGVFRDPSAWYHLVLAWDTTQSTAADRIILYVNGSRQALETYNEPSLNYEEAYINNNIQQDLGKAATAAKGYDGYMAEVHFVDGTALAPTSFGETKAGIWIPKAYTGSHGTNGYYLDFADGSALGDDESGNGNDFTPNGVASTDVVLDSPTNNFGTMNPLFTNGGSTQNFEEGNLKFTSDSNYALANGTFAMRSGKWYWETLIKTWVSVPIVGITQGTNTAGNSYVGYDPNGNVKGFGYDSGGYIYGAAGDGTASGAALASGQTTYAQDDIIGCSFDADAGELKFYKNNSLVYTISSINEHDWMPANSGYNSGVNIVNFGQDSSFAGNKTAQGNADGNGIGDFYYSPPSGFLALCSANLPAPAIDPAEDEEPADYFNTVLYTGNGTSVTDTQAISGVGFQPDWVWIKNRTSGAFHILNDSTRGAGKNLFINDNAVENGAGASTGDLFTSFDSDGFTVNYGYAGSGNSGTNQNTDSYVAWNWKINGGSTSNVSAGSSSNIRLIGGGTADQAAVQANTEAGISIVSFETTVRSSGTFCTFPHGLNSTPNMVWLKPRTADQYWAIYHDGAGLSTGSTISDLGFLGDTLGSNAFVGSTYWNTVNATSVKFDSAGNTDAVGDDMIAYCFHSVDGYSKLGSYTGNGSTDGAFVYTGFSPAWVMIKRTTGTQNWRIYDNKRVGYNVVDDSLQANLANTEDSNNSFNSLDFVSNGFKLRGNAGGDTNDSGTYIYLAFAEQPFKYSNAR